MSWKKTQVNNQKPFSSVLWISFTKEHGLKVRNQKGQNPYLGFWPLFPKPGANMSQHEYIYVKKIGSGNGGPRHVIRPRLHRHPWGWRPGFPWSLTTQDDRALWKTLLKWLQLSRVIMRRIAPTTWLWWWTDTSFSNSSFWYLTVPCDHLAATSFSKDFSRALQVGRHQWSSHYAGYDVCNPTSWTSPSMPSGSQTPQKIKITKDYKYQREDFGHTHTHLYIYI